VADIPPATQAMRYGNTAFRVWHARLTERSQELLLRVLPPDLAGAAVELGPYLVDAFGNATRVDYGTGHEATFAMLLLALVKLRVLPVAPGVVTRLYGRYLRLMRLLQATYWLEPAGSHGVWGLDDYCFLPFLWGAAQLEHHPELRPTCVHDAAAVQAGAAAGFLYLDAVAFVRRVKRGALHETSPMLADIAAVPSWGRVGAGLLRMFEAEVLGKAPIAQHFLTGSILRLTPGGEGGAPDPAVETPNAA
jgi:serine/threonine-protein phosphatase 2A activator